MYNNWIFSIDISKEWQLAQEDPDTVKQLCEKIVLKLKHIPKRLQDEHLEYIIENFNSFDPDTQDVDDFDVIMNELYNWADSGKRLWIDTFGRPNKSVPGT